MILFFILNGNIPTACSVNVCGGGGGARTRLIDKFFIHTGCKNIGIFCTSVSMAAVGSPIVFGQPSSI